MSSLWLTDALTKGVLGYKPGTPLTNKASLDCLLAVCLFLLHFGILGDRICHIGKYQC